MRSALAKFYWLMPMREMKKYCAEIHKVTDKVILDRLESKKDVLSMEEKGSRKFVLLDELTKETQDPMELRNETLHTFMAERDPTGALLGWVFYFLARYLAIYNNLRSTILNQFGTHSNIEEMDATKLRKCDYLQWVMHEVIRIVAIILMNERIALRDTTLPRGGGPDGSKPIFVRKGIQVLILHTPSDAVPTYGELMLKSSNRRDGRGGKLDGNGFCLGRSPPVSCA
ncbi:cytochrome P450 [Leptodontidium sp. 2 PMI_412]|nr:cytochrome P450 [Leptodontidium sp. 2 PMI_412]